MLDTTVAPWPEVANTAAVSVTPPDRTDRCSWWRPLDPALGMGELAWAENNQNYLISYTGRWVAIWGKQIIASGDSANEVYEYLKTGNIRGALVTFVQGIPNKWDNLIA